MPIWWGFVYLNVMRFGLIANVRRRGAQEAIATFLEWARKNRHTVIADTEAEKLTEKEIEYLPRHEIAPEVDILISMGGDGTLLASARAVGPAGTPLLGINLGSLGFLTQLSPRELEQALDDIVAGEYQIEERMVLKAEVDGSQDAEYPYALNDVVVDKGAISRLIEIVFKVNDQEIVQYRADGMVIATPTGSTAYSLAVGGPIMNPKMQGIIASPISSFSLSTRPMVFDPNDVLELTVKSHERVAGLTLDGQVMVPLLDTARVTISRADFTIKYIIFPDSSFYKVLRNKLHWGRPPRTGR